MTIVRSPALRPAVSIRRRAWPVLLVRVGDASCRQDSPRVELQHARRMMGDDRMRVRMPAVEHREGHGMRVYRAPARPCRSSIWAQPSSRRSRRRPARAWPSRRRSRARWHSRPRHPRRCRTTPSRAAEAAATTAQARRHGRRSRGRRRAASGREQRAIAGGGQLVEGMQPPAIVEPDARPASRRRCIIGARTAPCSRIAAAMAAKTSNGRWSLS